MGYISCSGSCRADYSSASAHRLDQVVNKIYVQGDVNINNGIQHSIAAQKVGDVHVYNTTIDNRVGAVNYVLNLDNRKVEFISPYVGDGPRGGERYLEKGDQYLLEGPSGNCYDTSGSQEYASSVTSGLLKRRRPVTQFVDSAEEVEELVRETFEKLTGQVFPDNIVVHVGSEKELQKAHSANGGVWHSGIMGFAINKWPDNSHIFILQNHLDALMLTVGHELGHVLSPQLGNAVDEEAKAFAFELAWAKCIVENDIGSLAESFDVDFVPASNGLHDRAFAFVQDVVQKGKDGLKVFWELAKGILKTRQAVSN